ncbi:MAG: hypothetical protein KGY56_14385 [Desulfobacterales bacterium]|nr:hypothetical protein [Desulfobacterales bacterium]
MRLISIGILFVFLQLFLVLPGVAKAWPVLGSDRIVPEIFETHSEALLGWAQKDISQAVLINIDAHDDLRWVEPAKIEKLQQIKQHGDWQAFSAADANGPDGLYNIGSFIYAAHKLEIVSKVYWVIPFPYFQAPEARKKLDQFLDDYGFLQKDIDTFAMRQGCYHGTYFDIPLVICGIDSLPRIEEPVVLSIDADFFPPFSGFYGRDILTATSVFFSRLAEREYRVQDAIISCSVDGGYLSIARRWIVEHCQEYLLEPENLSGTYPVTWLIRGLADIYYQNDDTEALLDLTRRYKHLHDQDLSLKVYHSFALLASGNAQEAFKTARTASLTDKRYAYLLADLGQCLIDREDLDAALKFFKEAYEINAGMNYRQKDLADALLYAGRYESALRYYDIYRQNNGSFPVDFIMGLTALMMGKEAEAGRRFELGFAGLQGEKYVSAGNEIDIRAIRAAAAYFKQKNMNKKAEFITSHPSLAAVFFQQPQKTNDH